MPRRVAARFDRGGLAVCCAGAALRSARWPIFTPDQISGPISIPRTANFYFGIALPNGTEGRAVVGIGDATDNPGDEPARFDRVAAALNVHVDGYGYGYGYDDVVQALKTPLASAST